MECKQVFFFILFQGMTNIAVFAAEGDSKFSRSAYFITREDKLFKGYVVERFKSRNLISCSQSCLRNAWCTSTNFRVSSKNGKGTCELNNYEISFIEANNKLYDEQGVIFTMLLKDLVYNRVTSGLPRPRENFTATFTCDDSIEMFADSTSLGKDNGNWRKSTDFAIPGNTRVISVAAEAWGFESGILGSFSNGLVTNESWKCNDTLYPGWSSPDFDDRNWSAAVVVAKHGASFWGNIAGISMTAKWIWTASKGFASIYCRLNLP